ncbi:hypothetical protein B0H12DRAFT_1080467 [Mycena haematopus]|nr:hypothetical protein B0H12DRAFT_1080467 [Mycena haematopus]
MSVQASPTLQFALHAQGVAAPRDLVFFNLDSRGTPRDVLHAPELRGHSSTPLYRSGQGKNKVDCTPHTAYPARSMMAEAVAGGERKRNRERVCPAELEEVGGDTISRLRGDHSLALGCSVDYTFSPNPRIRARMCEDRVADVTLDSFHVQIVCRNLSRSARDIADIDTWLIFRRNFVDSAYNGQILAERYSAKTPYISEISAAKFLPQTPVSSRSVGARFLDKKVHVISVDGSRGTRRKRS